MLSVEGVTAGYGGARPALAQVSIRVMPGELVAVLGPNGAGKSTFLKVATGILPCARGRVLLGGEDIATLERAAIARKVAVVAQESDVAYGFTVREVVAMGRAPHQRGWMHTSEDDRARVDRALAECDLTSLADRSARELSGGEKKRVAIARAFCQDAPVLVLDEPTASLDVRHQLALFDLLLAQRDRACVVVLHDLNLAAQYATRVVLFDRGHVVADGPPRDVMTWARLKDVFGADLYVGINDLTGAPFFLPMRR